LYQLALAEQHPSSAVTWVSSLWMWFATANKKKKKTFSNQKKRKRTSNKIVSTYCKALSFFVPIEVELSTLHWPFDFLVRNLECNGFVGISSKQEILKSGIRGFHSLFKCRHEAVTRLKSVLNFWVINLE
jgi:hypothetical protein